MRLFPVFKHIWSVPTTKVKSFIVIAVFRMFLYNMAFQIRLQIKFYLATIVLKTFVPIICMHFFVRFQITFMPKPLTAIFTFERFCTRVNFHMFSKTAQSGETSLAMLTFVRFLSSVSSLSQFWHVKTFFPVWVHFLNWKQTTDKQHFISENLT